MRRRTKVLLLLAALVVAGLSIATYVVLSIRIKDEDIIIEGNITYTREEMIAKILEDDKDYNPYILWWKTKYEKQKKIPFIDSYDIEINSMRSVTITVYEKEIVGCVEYKKVYMYFDKDGIIVESSRNLKEGVPVIAGLKFDYIVLNEYLPAGDDKVFDLILSVTQALKKYNVTTDKIYILSSGEVTLQLGNVKVLLGENKDMDRKVQNLSDLMPKLEGLNGTLDMKIYDSEKKGYTFRSN